MRVHGLPFILMWVDFGLFHGDVKHRNYFDGVINYLVATWKVDRLNKHWRGSYEASGSCDHMWEI